MNSDRRRLAKLALLFPSLPLVRPRLLTPVGAAAQRTQGNVSEKGAREIWWRTEWARIIELSGSWVVQSQPGITFLVPEDPACVLRLLRRSTGEVFEYRMEINGQVALAFGWILVSENAPLDCAGRGEHLMAERPDLGDDAYLTMDGIKVATIERMVVHGSRPFRFDPGEDDRYHLRTWREVDPSQQENRLVVQGIVGNVWEWPSEPRAVQTRVLFTRNAGDYSKGFLRIIEMVAKD